ncbi:MAG: ComEC/Rec2 family competence protein [Clostridia bacterium]
MRKNRNIAFFILIIVVICMFTGCNKTYTANGELSVHFIDVGQADCELIELPNGENMLIDAGNNSDSDLILSYLENLDITKIDYLVGTHPHEDHIGSLDTIINNFEIGKFYMPDAEADTKTYRDVISAAESKGLEIIPTYAGTTIYEDSDLKIKTVAPVRDYSDLNNTSIVIRLTYKKSSFLFTGDAEEKSERDITDDVSADVLKVGHHGSYTATSDLFLERVDPMYAVISCGMGNKYGHPHAETISKLYDNDVTVYRTDEMGTIICTTSGGGPADYKWRSE